MEQQEKKKWTVPELLVLVRNRMEETVLATCKANATTGPNNVNSSCAITDCITPCDALGAS